MATAQPTTDLQDFTKEGRQALESFYANQKIAGDVAARIAGLRRHAIKEDVLVTSEDGNDSPENELKALEYFVLVEMWGFNE